MTMITTPVNTIDLFWEENHFRYIVARSHL